MPDFFITADKAKEREEQLLNSGSALDLSEEFINLEQYSPGTKDDLERYMTDHMVKFFSIDEVVSPNHPDKALEVGLTELIAPLHLWPWVIMVLKVGDLMREAVGRGVRIRNVYRPMSYNKLVASSGIKSDHPNACSGDFDFKSLADRRIAEKAIRELHGNHPQLELSVGLGARTLHVGVMSPKGSRSWFYDSYPDERVKL